MESSGTIASNGSFATMAASGGFAISPTAGKAMTSAIDDVLDRLDLARWIFDRIKTGTPLGDSPAGQRMAEHNLAVAIGAASGEQALDDLRAVLTQHRVAIEQAIRHYREQDSHNAGGFG